jgi:hypothetical protein
MSKEAPSENEHFNNLPPDQAEALALLVMHSDLK